MASEKIIVLVSDKGDSKHGEISVLNDPQKAERLVETLLEAGFEAERIKVFTGRPSQFQVSQRPIVALVADGEEGESPPTTGDGSQEAAAGEPPADAEAAESDTKEDKADTEEETEQRKEEEAPATAQMAAPVKFSSLFRSA